VDAQEFARGYEKGLFPLKDPEYTEWIRLSKERTRYYPIGWQSTDVMAGFIQGQIAMIEAVGIHMRTINDDKGRRFEVGTFPFPQITTETSRFAGNGVIRGNVGSWLVSTFKDADRKHKVYFSPEKNIQPDSPPFFIWQTNQDDDPRQALMLAAELTDRGVPFELHCFPDGPHGMGLCDGKVLPYPGNSHAAHWIELAIEWLEEQGF
jgi:acetyl esterase/lipase